MRAARPDDPAPAPVRVGRAVLRPRTRAAPARARRLLRRLYPRRRAHRELGGLPRRGDRRRRRRRARRLPGGPRARLARRFVRLTLGRIPPWRLPGAVPPPARDRRRLAAPAARRALRRRARRRPRPPAPRRGARAARRGRPAWRRARGLRGVALDTGIENRAARALYERSGFTQRGLRPVPDERTARADRRLGLRRLRQAAVSDGARARRRRARPGPRVRPREERQRERARGDAPRRPGTRPARWPKRSR